MAAFLWSGIFTVAIPNTFWTIALQTGKTAKISNLAYITPFLSLIWTSLLLGEKVKFNSLIGLIIIVVGILIQMNEKEEN